MNLQGLAGVDPKSFEACPGARSGFNLKTLTVAGVFAIIAVACVRSAGKNHESVPQLIADSIRNTIDLSSIKNLKEIKIMSSGARGGLKYPLEAAGTKFRCESGK